METHNAYVIEDSQGNPIATGYGSLESMKETAEFKSNYLETACSFRILRDDENLTEIVKRIEEQSQSL
jgi:hypothetical protein